MGLTESNVTSLQLPEDVTLYQQTYERQELPSGAHVVKLNVIADDQSGWFKEVMRADQDGNVISLKEQGIEFRGIQANASRIAPHAERFWHVHPNRDDRPGQNEIWTPDATLLVGLVDLRRGSPTHGKESKVILTPEKALYIPAGVAHGFINPNNSPVTLLYLTDQHFNPVDSQEYRIDPRKLPYDFVKPEVM